MGIERAGVCSRRSLAGLRCLLADLTFPWDSSSASIPALAHARRQRRIHPLPSHRQSYSTHVKARLLTRLPRALLERFTLSFGIVATRSQRQMCSVHLPGIDVLTASHYFFAFAEASTLLKGPSSPAATCVSVHDRSHFPGSKTEFTCPSPYRNRAWIARAETRLVLT